MKHVEITTGSINKPGQMTKKQKRLQRQHQQEEKEREARPAKLLVKPHANARTSSTTLAHLSKTSFASLELSSSTHRAITEVLGYTQMTIVQQQTLPKALRGSDLIAKARTGTGKTIAFLLPTIERLVAADTSVGGVRALAISPTRELAGQIRDECEQLITFHKPRLSCQV